MEFAPTDRIDTRLTVVDWPSDADEEVTDAVIGVTTFELANDAPALVDDGRIRHLAWRGYLTGGLLTLYERLGALLSERGLGAFFADPRLEVFVPADGEIVVLGALRHPIRVARREWDRMVAEADSVEELAAGFVQQALEGAGHVIAAAREAAEERDHPLVAERPESITQVPPGEVDFDLLEDSDCELTERYDPGGNLEESWVSCDVVRWRTDFVAPGTIHPPDKVFEECTTWRVSQWQWVPLNDADEDADEDALHQASEWMLRAHAPITAQEVAGHLPEALLGWVRRMTLDGAEWMADLAESEPQFAAAAKRLRAASEGLP